MGKFREGVAAKQKAPEASISSRIFVEQSQPYTCQDQISTAYVLSFSSEAAGALGYPP